MRIAASTLWFFICLIAPAVAGTVSGRALGWRGDSTSRAVIWLEGRSSTAIPKANAVMTQQAGQFHPSFLIVTLGQTLEMPNLDEVAHNAYSFSPTQPFNLGFYAKGEYRSVTFTRPGLVEVSCSIHSFMRSRILVVPSIYYATVSADGTFRIPGVPAGEYILKFWADRALPSSNPITVPAAGVVQAVVHVTRADTGRK